MIFFRLTICLKHLKALTRAPSGRGVWETLFPGQGNAMGHLDKMALANDAIKVLRKFCSLSRHN